MNLKSFNPFKSNRPKISPGGMQNEQAAISQKEIVFRFRKDVQSEKGWCLMSCA